MLYCPKCHILSDKACPICGSESLREPEEKDWVYVRTEKPGEEPSASALFQEKGIPVLREGQETPGAAVKILIPFARVAEASALLEEYPEKEKLSPGKKAFWKALSVVLFLLLIALTVYATDFVAGWFRSLLS